jgi:hypothetical protein
MILDENSQRKAQFYAYWPILHTTKYSWCILLICLNILSVFSVQAKILLANLNTTLCFKKNTLKSPLSLCVCLKPFGSITEYG